MFVSYSHEDREVAEKLVAALRAHGFMVLWDKDLPYGMGFTDQIKNFIAHAHVFLPLITAESSRRGWVHQEIGYALALNIPVLPVCLGKMPSGLIERLHALPLSENPGMWARQLTPKIVESLVSRAQKNSRPLYECAEQTEDRTLLMVEYTQNILKLRAQADARVRQKGGLSSFHIPDAPVSHFLWRWRYGPRFNEYHCRLLRQERQLLEKFAVRCGVSLIIDGTLQFREYGELAMTARHWELWNFLKSMKDDHVIIALLDVDHPHREHHLTIVGDWFMAEAVSVHLVKGIRQTMFTRHAPSVCRRTQEFDEELHHLLAEEGLSPKESRQAALAEIATNLQGEIGRLLGTPSLWPEPAQGDTQRKLEKMLAEVTAA